MKDALVLAVHTQADDWVLDSGASFHTTSHQEIMTNYVALDFGKVYLANGESLNIMGLGDVRIKQPNGFVWILQKVRHISKLKKNFISDKSQIYIRFNHIYFVFCVVYHLFWTF